MTFDVLSLLTTVLALGGTAKDALAQTTGNQLLDWCQSNDQTFEVVCLTHIDGVVTGQRFGAITAMLLLSQKFVMDLPDDAFSKWKALKIGAVVGYCLPDGYSINQVRDVFVKHAEEHPETRHQEATSLLYASLKAAFPCES